MSDGEQNGPVFWPRVPAADAAKEWLALRCWVERLQSRFPALARLPACWWRHPQFVEALAALRDHESASYAKGGRLCGPVDFHRALADMEVRFDDWTRRLSCSGSRHHDAAAPVAATDAAEWQAFVEADVARRRARQT